MMQRTAKLNTKYIILKFKGYKMIKKTTLSQIDEKDIIKSLIEAEEIEKVLSGDIWIQINTKIEEFQKFGFFVQVEFKEIDGGDYDENTFSIFGYRNHLSADGVNTETDYDTTIFHLELPKEEILQIALCPEEGIEKDTSANSNSSNRRRR